jgi:pimeloyl-ACP methyl ester carboxylesterase
MYIKINDNNIYYQKVGRRGKDLILLHGWGQDVSTWWVVLDKLKDDFTLWLIDLPGFGRSDLPKKDLMVQDYADTIQVFITKLKIKKPHLLGHSHGGRISLKVAAYQGHLIDKLILEDSAGIKPKKGLKQLLAYPLAKIFKNLTPNWFHFKDRLKTMLYRYLESDFLEAGPLRGTLDQVVNEDLTLDIKKINNETLLIWGEKDRAVPLSDGKRIYRLIEPSRIEVIDEVGHFPHLENPDRFIYWVRNFLE